MATEAVSCLSWSAPVNKAMAAFNAFISSPSLRRFQPTGSIPSVQLHRFPSFISLNVPSLDASRGICQASSGPTSVPGPLAVKIDQDRDSVPLPVVLIDQDSDSNATIVEVSFGDRLGTFFDTMRSLKDLGLDVAKGSVSTKESVIQTKLFITHMDTGRKVEDPNMLERIRLTILNNLLKYHPECSERLALGEAFGIKAPDNKIDIDLATHIHIHDDGPKRSLLYIETTDRPGLLMEIIKILADINISVESAEIDTEGLVAKDKFHVSYRGAALNNSLSQVVMNCLRYYLRRPETDEDSY